jgi:hypothetical protein
MNTEGWQYKMTDEIDREMRQALKQAFPPVNTELHRDLWPVVLRKLDERAVRVPWYDWVLTGASLAVFLVFPRLVFVFVYHL